MEKIIDAIHEDDYDKFGSLIGEYYSLSEYRDMIYEIYSNTKNAEFAILLGEKCFKTFIKEIIRFSKTEYYDSLKWFLQCLSEDRRREIGNKIIIDEDVPEEFIEITLGSNFWIEIDIFEDDPHMLYCIGQDRLKFILDHCTEEAVKHVLYRCISMGNLDLVELVCQYGVDYHIPIDIIMEKALRINYCSRCESESFDTIYTMAKTCNSLKEMGFTFYYENKKKDNPIEEIRRVCQIFDGLNIIE